MIFRGQEVSDEQPPPPKDELDKICDWLYGFAQQHPDYDGPPLFFVGMRTYELINERMHERYPVGDKNGKKDCSDTD